jgi:hypothetical protein
MQGLAAFVCLLFPVSLPLSAQVPFPLAPALETACFGGIFAPGADPAAASAWQPDWPADIPPDAFRVKGDAALIRLSGTLLRGREPETALSPFEYRLSRDGGGRLVEFPLSLGGDLFQIRADYAPSGGVAGLVFDGTGEGEAEAEREPWTAAFPLPYRLFESPAPKFPGEAARVSRGEAVYFVLFEEGGNYLSESWYDPEGNLAGYFVSLFEEWEGRRRIVSVLDFDGSKRYYFENRGYVSAIRGPGGNFSALYGARGELLEWELAPAEGELPPPGRFTLQWDEGFLLVNMGDSPFLPSAVPAEPPLERRYEYTLDRRGNWLSRRETLYALRGGLLIPAGVKQIDRYILYREEEQP